MFAAIPFPDLSPDLFSFSLGNFTFALRWYALAYIVGIIIAWRLAVFAVGRPALWPNQTPPMIKPQIEDMLTWLILGIILGGRLGYVLFYQPEYYFANPLDVFKIWQGGMAFHGGAAGVIIAMLIYARRRGFEFLRLADFVCACVPIGLFFGRLANFINGELYGRVTDSPLGMVFPRGGPEPRHPSQIYEAVLEGAVLFFILWCLVRAPSVRERPGIVAGVFLIGYSTFRGFVELFREPDAHIGLMNGVSMGQILSTPMLIAGSVIVYYAIRRAKHANTA